MTDLLPATAAPHTPEWRLARAVAYAADARIFVDQIRQYEDDHPDDAPCLAPLLLAVPGIEWRGHVPEAATA